jgi:hypothetical protein
MQRSLFLLLIFAQALASCAGVKDSAPTVPSVLLDRPVYFTNQDGSDTVATPGLYEVMASGESSLRLIPSQSHEGFVIRATAFTFEEKLPSPVALAVPDNESDYHVVLLTPGGDGLVASGSLQEVRQRGVGSVSLAKSKIKSALARYRAREETKDQLATFPRLPLGKDEWQYQIDGIWMTEQQALDRLTQMQK